MKQLFNAITSGGFREHYLLKAIYSHDVERARFWLSVGANPSGNVLHSGSAHNNLDARCPFQEAVKQAVFEKHDLLIVALLLKNGANPDGKMRYHNGYGDAPDMPPLVIAICHGRHDLFDILLTHGADINLNRGFGAPLYFAAARRRGDMARVLIDRGALVKPDILRPVGLFLTILEQIGIPRSSIPDTSIQYISPVFDPRSPKFDSTVNPQGWC